MDIKKRFGLLLMAQINGRMNQSTLADLANVSEGTISGYKKGKRFPQADELERILKVLKCDIALVPLSNANNETSAIEHAVKVHPDLTPEDTKEIIWFVHQKIDYRRHGDPPGAARGEHRGAGG